MSQQFVVELKMIRDAQQQLLRLREESPKIASALFKNFINPLRSQNRAEHLRGKYKPSWKLPLDNANAMRKELAKICEQNKCYHYHFGFPYYQTGRDPEFKGDESAGIVHTVFDSAPDVESHVMLKVDEKHPHPFQVPIHLLAQVPTAG